MIKEQERNIPNADVYRKHGISTASFYKYKPKFGGMDVSDARILKALDDENSKLKNLLAEHMLDNPILKDVNSKKLMTPAAKRKAMIHLCDQQGMSQRRLRDVLEVDRSSVRYHGTRPDKADLRKAVKDLAAEHRSFGYRLIHIMLERQGIHMSRKKLWRLYREEGLQVRRRDGGKCALGIHHPMVAPGMISERWSLEFVSDAFTDGRRFRIFAVVDEFSQEYLAVVPDTSRSCELFTPELDAIIRMRGMPKMIVSDNGTEVISSAMFKWCRKRKIDWHYTAPGKSTQNIFIESLDGSFPEECLNETLLSSLTEVRMEITKWKEDYNQNRPHSSLDNRRPNESAAKMTLQKQAV